MLFKWDLLHEYIVPVTRNLGLKLFPTNSSVGKCARYDNLHFVSLANEQFIKIEQRSLH